MKPIIQAVAKEKLIAELTTDKFVRKTNYDNNEVYIFSHHDSPNLTREVGRLREESFRDGGGGTGKEIDIDKYDTAEYPYQQLIVWNPHEQEIVGGYRFIFCKNIPRDANGNVMLATSKLFNFSEKFINEYLPYSIELGRSFVRPEYQSRKAGRKAIFALDNLWDGLGALTIDNPDIKYLFGKVTMYLSFNKKARDIILYFLKTIFPDKENLLQPHKSLPFYTDEEELKTIFTGKTYQENYRILSQKVRELNENVPPLINSYMNLSPSLKSFGTAMNESFGEVEETGLLLTIADIYPSKSKRHIETYKSKY